MSSHDQSNRISAVTPTLRGEPLAGILKGKQGELALSPKGQSNTVGKGQGRPRRCQYVCVCMHGFSCAFLLDWI